MGDYKEYRLPEVVDRRRINPSGGAMGEYAPARCCNVRTVEANPKRFSYCTDCAAKAGIVKTPTSRLTVDDVLPYVVLTPSTKFALSWVEQIEAREAQRFNREPKQEPKQA